MVGHSNDYDLKRTTTGFQKPFDDSFAVQGRVLWLPAKEDLPERAVRRAHGKGAIEEGIFNHPVVVVSRPAEESNVIHFNLITSLQGRRLDQLYNKSNEFHASRRSWYLPIFPTPDHPDALSKKTKKRFPTLELANQETLRWDSYVNIRHVYKIDLSLMRPYTNPEMPNAESFHFERESTLRMLAKGKSLTLYEPGQQYVSPRLKRSASDPLPESTGAISRMPEDTYISQPMRASDRTVADTAMAAPVPAQSDFRMESTGVDRIAGPPPKVPPDGEKVSALLSVEQIVEPLERFCRDVQSGTLVAQQRIASRARSIVTLKLPRIRLWQHVKGVTAVIIASL
ncbi:hypothetical protein DE146DRAFT_160349 [Phaeosphaeria sp. MPI-PUGE-AT-0046c]|nr:hypothetical protein DE146DRAFT_160349 [Phaeosphaeria sp. MPI-PUGE-AT-0046c]